MQRAAHSKPELLRLLQMLSPSDRRVMAQLWNVPVPDAAALEAAMTDPERVMAQWDGLREPERAALTRVLSDGGSLPVAVMHRESGGVREPGGFEHPRAYIQALRTPATPTERLYSMGLIFRMHDERGAIYRVPNDLRSLLPAVPPRDRCLHVMPAPAPPNIAPGTPTAAEHLIVALLTLAYNGELKALDDGALSKPSLVKLARALPSHPDLRTVRREAEWPLVALLRVMALEAGLIKRANSGELRPTSHALEWLQAAQAERVRRLLNGWCASTLDDLTVLCDLRWKGGTPYTLNRTATRRGLLRLLKTLPAGEWVALPALVDAIHTIEPDFQRRDGRYDTWLLYNAQGELVSGWEQWELVEGALIRHVLCGPLHWLGLFDTDAQQPNASTAVRITELGTHLLADEPAPPTMLDVPLIVQSTFEVLCPPGASLYARFQLGRIAEVQQSATVTIYRLTRRAVLGAAERGIAAHDVLRFLETYSAGNVPPSVAYTLLEWGGQAEQVRLETAVLLHTADPIVLAQLRKDQSLGLSDVEPLAPTLLRVPDGAADLVADQIRRAGWGLRDERIDPQLPLDDRDLKALVRAAYAYTRICNELQLPCEIPPTLLQRLGKLVPPRWLESADQSADQIVAHLLQRSTTTDRDPEAQ
jgi:hypothetical protein